MLLFFLARLNDFIDGGWCWQDECIICVTNISLFYHFTVYSNLELWSFCCCNYLIHYPDEKITYSHLLWMLFSKLNMSTPPSQTLKNTQTFKPCLCKFFHLPTDFLLFILKIPFNWNWIHELVAYILPCLMISWWGWPDECI